MEKKKAKENENPSFYVAYNHTYFAYINTPTMTTDSLCVYDDCGMTKKAKERYSNNFNNMNWCLQLGISLCASWAFFRQCWMDGIIRKSMPVLWYSLGLAAKAIMNFCEREASCSSCSSILDHKKNCCAWNLSRLEEENRWKWNVIN